MIALGDVTSTLLNSLLPAIGYGNQNDSFTQNKVISDSQPRISHHSYPSAKFTTNLPPTQINLLESSTLKVATMADTPPPPSSSVPSTPPSSAADQARIRKERREAKIKAGGSARLNKISGLGGGLQRGTDSRLPLNSSRRTPPWRGDQLTIVNRASTTSTSSFSFSSRPRRSRHLPALLPTCRHISSPRSILKHEPIARQHQ